MVRTHTEAVLKKLSNQELVQLFLNIEVNMDSKLSAMSSDIKDLLRYFRKFKADVALLKKLNKNLLEQITDTGGSVSKFPVFAPAGETPLEDKVWQVFREIGVEYGKKNMQPINLKTTNLK